MSYIVLARKHRPNLFADVIGQEHISRTLKNALKLGKNAHAYIFSGPRGVGKTTMARILAKALNCRMPVDFEPCGKCDMCAEIARGSSLDMIEIDAASNRGIDEIRALRENVQFAPASGKYKVYIIDEAHQITTDAYNALLKTIEEPPSHVIFILATTDPHKIPATIFSRCQRFVFRALSVEELKNHLSAVASKESVAAEPGVFEIIAKSAGGSVRDSLSVLDQMISFSQSEIKLEDVRFVLGYMPDEVISRVFTAIASRDAKSILELLDELFRKGFDMAQFAKNILECFHEIMLARCGLSVESVSAKRSELIYAMKEKLSEEEIARDIELLDKAVSEMRRTGEFRLVLQACLYKLAAPFVSLESVINKIDGIIGDCPEISKADYTPPLVKPAPNSVEVKASEELILMPAAPEPAADKPEHKKPRFQEVWKKTVDEIDKVKPSISQALRDCVINSAGEREFELLFTNKFNLTQFERNKGLVEKKFETVSGIARSVILNGKLSSLSAQAGALEPAEENTPEAAGAMMPGSSDAPQSGKNELEDLESVKNDAAVKKVLDVFGGKIVSVSKRKNK